MAPVRAMRDRLWLFGGVTIALAVVMGTGISASVARRLARMRQGFLAVASGDLQHRIATDHTDEIGDLARTFDSMASRLQETLVSRDNLAAEVAERRRAEARLEEARQDLERSNRDLEQFAYAASHDLQEPLRKIRSFTELLARRYKGQLDERADKYVDYIVDGATRMQRLIMDLLTYSRVGRGELETEPTDANRVLSETLDDLEQAIEESGAKIEVAPLPTLPANPRQIKLVFQNLLANAIKFRREAPVIAVAAEQRGGEWVFSVRDNGIGMKPEYFDRIFQVFQRLHSRDEYPGTGIGLAVCKKIVERHGGRIWVESQPGQGSCFFFSIPLNRPKSSAMPKEERHAD